MEHCVTSASTSDAALVVWLHGLGDTGEGWEHLEHVVGRHFSCLRWVFPTAPVQPVSVNSGAVMTSWFDILNIPVDENEPDNPVGLVESISAVHKLLNDNIVSGGLDSRRIFLGGFSQGAVMSLAAGLSFDKPLGGIIALSGWLTRKSQLSDSLAEANRETPVLICHGQSDAVVSYQLGSQAAELLGSIGYSVFFKSYRGLGHGSNQEEMREIHALLSNSLDATKK